MRRLTKVRVARKSVAHIRIRNQEFWNTSPERQYFTTEKLRYTRKPFTAYIKSALCLLVLTKVTQ